MMAAKLRNLPNVEVLDWKPHLHDEAWAIISSLYFPDGGVEEANAMEASGEPWLPLSKWIIKENPCVKKLSMHKLWYWEEEREAYRKEYAKVWNDTATGRDNTGQLMGAVDAIICPVGPGVAPRHNTAKYWCYTSQWNLLDYPALVFPVTRVDPGQDVNDGHEPMNDLDRENWDLCECIEIELQENWTDRWRTDDPQVFSGLPVCLQLVCRRFEDEKVVEILKFIQSRVKLPVDS
jgi:amidase